MVVRWMGLGLALVVLGGALGVSPPASAQIPCLYIPIFGPDDPHSTCLTRDQLKRRSIVLQCQREDNETPEGSRPAELVYIVTGERDGIGALAEAFPKKPRFTCAWERSK